MASEGCCNFVLRVLRLAIAGEDDALLCTHHKLGRLDMDKVTFHSNSICHCFCLVASPSWIRTPVQCLPAQFQVCSRQTPGRGSPLVPQVYGYPTTSPAHLWTWRIHQNLCVWVGGGREGRGEERGRRAVDRGDLSMIISN